MLMTHLVLTDRIVILISEQRGDRGRPAAEIILLTDGAAECPFLYALYIATFKARQCWHEYTASLQRRRRDRVARQSPNRCALTMVTYCICTLDDCRALDNGRYFPSSG